MFLTDRKIVVHVVMKAMDYETLDWHENLDIAYFDNLPKISISQDDYAGIVEDLDQCGEEVQDWADASHCRRVVWEIIGTLTWLQNHPELI